MTVDVSRERPDLLVLKFRGEMKKREFEAIQSDTEETLDRNAPISVLCLFEDFSGWDSGDWADPKLHEFAFAHEADVSRIALVCADERWKDDLMAFAGAPYTKRDVRWFAAEAEARTWLG